MIKKYIPNTITCLNLFAGCMSVTVSFAGDFEVAFLLILLAAVFDFMDGMAARMLKAYSAMGKELDSLADMVSFGLAPAVMVYEVISRSDMPDMLTYLAYLIAVFSALRLAKFNIDERQTTSFIGLPTPANALFWGGMISAYSTFVMVHPYWTLGLIVLMSLLLVSELPLFSLKFKSLRFSDNVVRYLFLGGAVVTIAGFVVMPNKWWLTSVLESFVWVILWYVVLSVAVWIKSKISK